MTTPIDKAQLRALAETIIAADGPIWWVEQDFRAVREVLDATIDDAQFVAAATPTAILALLDELATQAAQIEACRAEAARVSGYFVSISDRPFASEVLVQRSRQMEGPPKWAARLDGECLNKDGAWEWEPMPSSRDDEFLARCRFDTAAEAIAAVHAAMKEKTP